MVRGSEGETPGRGSALLHPAGEGSTMQLDLSNEMECILPSWLQQSDPDIPPSSCGSRRKFAQWGDEPFSKDSLCKCEFPDVKQNCLWVVLTQPDQESLGVPHQVSQMWLGQLLQQFILCWQLSVTPNCGFPLWGFTRKQIIKQHSMFVFGFERLYTHCKYWRGIKSVKEENLSYPRHCIQGWMVCCVPALFFSHIHTCKQIAQVRQEPCFVCKDETLFCICFQSLNLSFKSISQTFISSHWEQGSWTGEVIAKALAGLVQESTWCLMFIPGR